MRTITEEVGKTSEGIRMVRNYFMYDDNINYFNSSKSYFAKDEKKEAKINYKKDLKTFSHNEKRNELIQYMVSQELPNWNIKLRLL